MMHLEHHLLVKKSIFVELAYTIVLQRALASASLSTTVLALLPALLRFFPIVAFSVTQNALPV